MNPIKVSRSLAGVILFGNLISGAVVAAENPDPVSQVDQVDIETAWEFADEFRSRGQYREALRYIEMAAIAQVEGRTEEEQALTALRAAGILTGLGLYEKAGRLLSQVSQAQAQNSNELLSAGSQIALEMELGRLAVEQELLATAQSRFNAARELAGENGLSFHEARALLNALRAQMDNQDLTALEDRLARLQALINRLEGTDEKAFLLVAAGDLHRRVVDEFDSDVSLLEVAYDSFMEATTYAQTDETRSQVYGFLGALYERESEEHYNDVLQLDENRQLDSGFMGDLYEREVEERLREGEDRLVDAQQLTEQAIFYAQAARADDQMYRWEWQLGRIMEAQSEVNQRQGRTEEARSGLDQARQVYQRSVSTMDRIRSNFGLGSRSTFESLIAPVYMDYADVLLRQAAATNSQVERGKLLYAVIDHLESLKRGELEDYFGNQCVEKTDLDESPGRSTETGVAIIYPVILEDRVEVLVEAGGTIIRYAEDEDAGEIARRIKALRLSLERTSSGDSYIEHAQILYQWLIEPAITTLEQHNIHTLMMVPGGALRTIPLGALHDGKHFLIEHYAIANTPAIRLLDLSKTNRAANLLIGGVTESVQGFIALDGAADEIERVASMFSHEILQDETFLLKSVEEQLASPKFSIAHFATHGEISGNFRESYLITYQNRLTLDGLKSILDKRADPLDLLVLSACYTASGDERAVLGLAGMAVQSGARSVIASIWPIDDVATKELITSFYEKLNTGEFTKAESLRQAQLELMGNDEFKHPGFWAPYLLIGSWL